MKIYTSICIDIFNFNMARGNNSKKKSMSYNKLLLIKTNLRYIYFRIYESYTNRLNNFVFKTFFFSNLLITSSKSIILVFCTLVY